MRRNRQTPETSESRGGRSEQGLLEGFEGYLTPSPEDYRDVLRGGMVVPDANVLLNLYRFTKEARSDLIAVFEGLGDRLWVPHRVVEEFWRNREAVLRDRQDARVTTVQLEKLSDQAVEAIRSWSQRISLNDEQTTGLESDVRETFRRTEEQIEEITTASADDAAIDTNADRILESIGRLLNGKVGDRLADVDMEVVSQEGHRRLERGIPPGFMDKNKDPERAIGDFIVWEQLIRETERRSCDVLFVTADLKEDWWRLEGKERRGPRPELARELKERAGTRLLMSRIPTLLRLGREYLSVEVSATSVENVDRVEESLAERLRLRQSGGWNSAAATALLEQLDASYPEQARALRAAVQNGGFVSREDVYQVAGYPDDRSLRGFTRPTNRIAQTLRDSSLITVDAVDVLTTVYDDTQSIGWAAGFRVPESVLPLFEEILLMPEGHVRTKGS